MCNFGRKLVLFGFVNFSLFNQLWAFFSLIVHCSFALILIVGVIRINFWFASVFDIFGKIPKDDFALKVPLSFLKAPCRKILEFSF
jgi:hypothetical protein